LLELNNIYNEDCIYGMKRIDAESIDLIITDPPYLINYQSAMRTDRFDKIEGDKGTKSDYNLITNSLNELHRVLKEGSHIYMFCSWHNIDFFKQEFQKHFELKNILIWKKKGGFIGDLETQYGVDYEFILFGFKKWEYYDVDKDCNSYPLVRGYFKKLQKHIGLKLKEINTHLGHRKAEHCFYWKTTQWDMPTKETYNELIRTFNIDNWNEFKEFNSLKVEYDKLKYIYNKRKPLNGKRISGIIETSKVPNKEYIHPTQKPEEIINILIEKSSIENDIILDPFIGSGTTAIASMNTNRQYIGFELDNTYYDLAQKRIEEHIN